MAAAPAPAVDYYGLRRKRFRRDEINRMLELGLFDGQRFELIDGDLIDKMGQGPKHFRAIQRLAKQLSLLFDMERIRIQGPMEAGGADREWSQPEPDLAVLAEPSPDLRLRHPYGHELMLAVEVADSSFRKDSTRKREIYAAAGVPEYWVLDLESRRLLVFRDLRDGDYRDSALLTESEPAPLVQVPVSALLD